VNLLDSISSGWIRGDINFNPSSSRVESERENNWWKGGVFFKAVSRFKLIAGKWERERERERVDYMIILYIILFNKIQVFGGSMGSSVFPI
jgi:hypothetical protein